MKEDLGLSDKDDPAFVTVGETMVRDTPADDERLERTRRVNVSLAGSEFTLAIMLARLGIHSADVTRMPDNPYGLAAAQRGARAGGQHRPRRSGRQGGAHQSPAYQLARTPRRGAGWYQRKCSAASCLGPGIVDWGNALRAARLFHTSAITFGLSTHSGYDRNYLLATVPEALRAEPADCLVGLDFNYQGTLWSPDQCRGVMTPLITEHVDVLITTSEDMARIYRMDCGSVSAGDIAWRIPTSEPLCRSC